MTPEEFIEKWRNVESTERAGAQAHFIDLCHMLGVPTPQEADPRGKTYSFEKRVTKPGGRGGFADVWKKNCFAWEYKGEQKNLVAAYSQLKEYADALENPPLLIVSDMQEIRIHTNFTNMIAEKVSLLCTDGLGSYYGLYKNFAVHEALDHERGQYVVGSIHTNTIERFWSIFKRGIVGSFHKVSAKYLPLYVAEFCFRYNNRENPAIFGAAIRGC